MLKKDAYAVERAVLLLVCVLFIMIVWTLRWETLLAVLLSVATFVVNEIFIQIANIVERRGERREQ